MAVCRVVFKRIKKTNRVLASFVRYTDEGREVVAQKKFHHYQTTDGVIDPNVQKWAKPLADMYALLEGSK